MKKYLCLLPILFFLACQQNAVEQAPVEETVVKAYPISVKGQIANPLDEEVTIRKGEDKYTATHTDGQFSLNFEATEAGKYYLLHGNQRTMLYLEPGDAIHIELNGEDFDKSLQFTGKGAEESQYLADKYNKTEELKGDTKAFYSLAEQGFIDKAASLKEALQAHLSAFVEKHPDINSDFAQTEKIDIDYDWANTRMNYANYHGHFVEQKDFEASANYYDFLNELDLKDEQKLSSKSFKSTISKYIAHLSSKDQPEDSEMKAAEKAMQKFTIIKANFPGEAIRNYALYDITKDMVTYEGDQVNDALIAAYNESSTDDDNKKEIAEAYSKWEALAVGEPAPDFKYMDIAGKEIALSDLKGKNVYIDVWATWCGPCKKELPHLEELQEQYKDNKSMVFASVSIDKNKEAWEKMVKEKEMKGLQLIGDNAWESSICDKYLIKSIPRFILVDKEGMILNVNAPRPSSEEIKTIFSSLAKPKISMN